jgi:multiple sugar transport system permease protein/putative aldouronate transport system permease protein
MATSRLSSKPRPEAVEAVGSLRAATDQPRRKSNHAILAGLHHSWQLYLLLALPTAVLLIFSYAPMVGIQIAFRNYSPRLGQWGSPWIGLQNFDRFFHSYQFWLIIKNTLVLFAYDMVATFPLPIILALSLNQVRLRVFRRSVQMITYAPYFISTVVIVGMIFLLLDPQMGLMRAAGTLLGIDVPNLTQEPGAFRHLYVWSGAWQTMGFWSVIYLAALSGIDPVLHEAAKVDGCSLLGRIWHIDLPGIAPVAVILLILSMGNALRSGFEKVLLLQTPLNLSTSEVIDTYVYKVSLGSQLPQFSYGTAISVFQSLVGLVLIIVVNLVARRFSSGGLL